VVNLDVLKLCDEVRQTAFDIHVYFKSGFLERVYENALVSRLRKQGKHVQQQVPIQVKDFDGTVVGDYIADLLVEHTLLVELKAVSALQDLHRAQLIGYLRGAHLEHGLLINFGAAKLEVKKFTIAELV
jgi:GxxExxY protein